MTPRQLLNVAEIGPTGVSSMLPTVLLETSKVGDKLLEDGITEMVINDSGARISRKQLAELVDEHGGCSGALHDLKPTNPNERLSKEVIACVEKTISSHNNVRTSEDLLIYLGGISMLKEREGINILKNVWEARHLSKTTKESVYIAFAKFVARTDSLKTHGPLIQAMYNELDLALANQHAQ